MNKRAFRRALRYGFGRAILHLQTHDATPYRDDILDGCLHFWGYDGQVETERPNYMFEVITLTGEADSYRNHILAEVETATDDRDGDQLFALARLFAERGDTEARAALDRALARLPFHDDLTADEIRRRGPEGLVHVIRLQLAYLDEEGDTEHNVADFGWQVKEAQKTWGKRAFASAIREAGQGDSRITLLWKQIRDEVNHWEKPRGSRPVEPLLASDQVLEVLSDPCLAEKFGGSSSHAILRHWANTVDETEWANMCQELSSLPLDDARFVRAMRLLFKSRAFAGDPDRLISIVRADGIHRTHIASHLSFERDRIPMHAMIALAKIANPHVRSFALELLQDSTWRSHAASLIEANYEDGDLQLLADAFHRERNEWQRHGIGISIRSIDTKYAPPEAPLVLKMLYENVRCGLCRRDFVEGLHEHGALPDSIAEECRYDAYFDLRDLIAELRPLPPTA